jgi:hypothetical protein
MKNAGLPLLVVNFLNPFTVVAAAATNHDIHGILIIYVLDDFLVPSN